MHHRRGYYVATFTWDTRLIVHETERVHDERQRPIVPTRMYIPRIEVNIFFNYPLVHHLSGNLEKILISSENIA